MDSRPSEDQAAFAGRGRSDEGLALWLPSLSDPLIIAHATPIQARHHRCVRYPGPSPGGTILPSSISRASSALRARSPWVSTPEPAACEIGSPPRPRRMMAHPTAIAAPISGPLTYTQYRSSRRRPVRGRRNAPDSWRCRSRGRPTGRPARCTRRRRAPRARPRSGQPTRSRG